MVCPNCAHSYPISNGIPNMVRPPPPLLPSRAPLGTPLTR